MRIVSLDYCADQYVLALADRAQIAALSPGAMRDDSYYRVRAQGVRHIRSSFEDALSLRPDLVVRDWGGPWDATQAFTRLGVPVLNIGGVHDFVGARTTLLRAAQTMGQRGRGEELALDLDRRLTHLQMRDWGGRPVLYLSAAGASAGPGVMMDAVIRAGGGRNAKREPGWSVAPLEDLVRMPPALIALGFFDTGRTAMDAWSPARHPAMRRALARAETVSLPAAAISCEAWYAIDAAERIADALDPRA
jgi:iron complex transport system substrate-binding protein